MDPGQILSPDDCEIERTPGEFIRWVDHINRLFARSREGRDYVRARKGLARRFVDAIYPFSRLARLLFEERRDVVCKANVVDEDCDALFIDYRQRPLRVHKLEFAHAIHSYEEYVRRVYLPEDGWVATMGKLKARAHDSERTGESPSKVVWLNKSLELIAETARRTRARRHERDTSLVILVDDYAAFSAAQDLKALERFVRSEVLPLDLDFHRLLLLGWSGQTLRVFPLSSRFSRAQGM